MTKRKIVQIASAIDQSTPTRQVAFYVVTDDGEVYAWICDAHGWRWQPLPALP